MAKAIGKIVIVNGEIIETKNFRNTEKYNTIYEVLRVMDAKPLFFEDHYSRFEKSLLLAGFKSRTDSKVFFEGIRSLISENEIAEGNIWFQINEHADRAIFQLQHKYPSPEMYASGVRTITLKAEREKAEVKQTSVKHKIEEAIQKQQIKENIYEYVLVNHLGEITEGSSSNLFFIKNDTLFTTPDKYVLKGITRQKVIELAWTNNLPLNFTAVKEDELSAYDAVFITGTSPKVLPVSQVNGYQYKINNSLLQTMMVLYDESIRNYLKSS